MKNTKLSNNDVGLLKDIINDIDTYKMNTISKIDMIKLALHVSTISKILLKSNKNIKGTK